MEATYICDECGEPSTYDLMRLRDEEQLCILCDRNYWEAWKKANRERIGV